MTNPTNPERIDLPNGYWIEGNSIFQNDDGKILVARFVNSPIKAFNRDRRNAFAAAMQPHAGDAERPTDVNRFMNQMAEFGEVFVECKEDMYWMDTIHSYILKLEATRPSSNALREAENNDILRLCRWWMEYYGPPSAGNQPVKHRFYSLDEKRQGEADYHSLLAKIDAALATPQVGGNGNAAQPSADAVECAREVEKMATGIKLSGKMAYSKSIAAEVIQQYGDARVAELTQRNAELVAMLKKVTDSYEWACFADLGVEGFRNLGMDESGEFKSDEAMTDDDLGWEGMGEECDADVINEARQLLASQGGNGGR